MEIELIEDLGDSSGELSNNNFFRQAEELEKKM